MAHDSDGASKDPVAAIASFRMALSVSIRERAGRHRWLTLDQGRLRLSVDFRFRPATAHQAFISAG